MHHREDRHIAILAEHMYEDLELWYPALRLREEGAAVTIVGAEDDTYTSKHGYPVHVDAPAAQVRAADFDAVIIPGGYAPDYMRRHPAMIKLVRDAFEQEKVVAAICHAAWVLISAGVVRGRRLTCFPSIKDDVINAGGQYEDSEVVRHGTLITSRRPEDLPAFCRTIIAALAEAPVPAAR